MFDNYKYANHREMLETELDGAVEALSILKGMTSVGEYGFVHEDLCEEDLQLEITRITEELNQLDQKIAADIVKYEVFG